MALPKENRLRRRQDFNAVYQGGIRRNSAHLTLRALRPQDSRPDTAGSIVQSQHQLPTRIGISISQKVSKRAVIRNRIKRQIRAIFREFLSRLSPGWQLVIVVRPNAIECDYGQFLRELEQLLAEAKILHGN